MTLDYELADRVVSLLNDALNMDRNAIAALVENRVPCNGLLAAHRTFQVSSQNHGYAVGVLGLLNGLCGVDSRGNGCIQAVFASTEDCVESGEVQYLNRFVVVRTDLENVVDVPMIRCGYCETLVADITTKDCEFCGESDLCENCISVEDHQCTMFHHKGPDR